MFENSQVVYDFQQNELLDGNVSQSKLDVQLVESWSYNTKQE